MLIMHCRQRAKKATISGGCSLRFQHATLAEHGEAGSKKFPGRFRETRVVLLLE